MSGLGLVFNIARDALAAQRYGMDVTAHNIANLNTPGYSRQRPVYEAKQPGFYGGVLLGRGVDTDQVMRLCDQFLENRLTQQKSSLLSSKEMENYILVIENLFNENQETGISTTLSGFWNLWHDIANNPSGASERIALYEHSLLLVSQFNRLDTDLIQLQTDLSHAVRDGIDKINQITEEISQLNNQIVGIEAGSTANDLRDKRNTLVSELAEYIDVKSFEQDNGSLTIITAKGCVLVHGNKSYDLELGGDNGDRVKWQGSGGVTVDITNYITKGKMGGWLDMRDEVIAKYQLDLSAVAKALIWAVNQQHGQGIGLKLFQPGSTLTGTYETSTDLGDLSFGDEIEFISDGFKLWIEDRTDPNNPVMNAVSVDLSSLDGTSSLSDLATTINNQISTAGLTGVSADGSGTALSLTAGNSYAFGFSDDKSHILAALGINTYFQGNGAGSIDINPVIKDKDFIASGKIDTEGHYASGDNSNALSIADLQYTPLSVSQWTCDRINGNTEGSITATIEGSYHAMVGSIGVLSSSISRNNAFNEIMTKKLGEIRDGISAVSIDEEMTNLIRFQHAYGAAAKLIKVSDELLKTLLDIK